jgi:hypothetical protein
MDGLAGGEQDDGINGKALVADAGLARFCECVASTFLYGKSEPEAPSAEGYNDLALRIRSLSG